MYVWDTLAEGSIMKNVVLVLFMGLLLLGAAMASLYGSTERKMTEEDFEELEKRIEEWKMCK